MEESKQKPFINCINIFLNEYQDVRFANVGHSGFATENQKKLIREYLTKMQDLVKELNRKLEVMENKGEIL
jgi:hypothetical protein